MYFKKPVNIPNRYPKPTFQSSEPAQPIGSASCGSVFRNPADASVGKMVEDCGLKGFCVGGAEVSPIHGNFIVNKGTASAADVVAVIHHVHEKVKDAYGIELQPEVKFLGF